MDRLFAKHAIYMAETPMDIIRDTMNDIQWDARLLEPVLFMQKHLEKLMYEMGEYILKAYNCFEE